MNKRTKIKNIFNAPVEMSYTVMGWVRTFRNNQFIALNDGSCLANLQVVVDFESWDAALLKRITTGAALHIEGKLIASQGKGQTVELKAEKIDILGDCDPEVFPLQPKKHSLEFLREIAHLRFRTNTFSAISRVKQTLFYGIHKFFNDRDFVNVHAPIITGSDAEGAGEMFQVTTLDMNNPPKKEDGSINYKDDFFGKATNLTVSGQLQAELAALALGSVYTFGPTFRAEKSNTTRHLAEFWMMEPEVAFNDLHDNMDLAEDMLKFLIQYALDNCKEDLEFLEQRLIDDEKTKPQAERSEMTLTEKLKFCLAEPFQRLTYTEAIEILKNSTPNKKGKFQFPIDKWGADLQSEHERYLVEKHFKKPVILTNYPADIKAFYMRQDDPKEGVAGPTVSAMDILFPGIGEIIGGSQREERLDLLLRRMNEMHIPAEEMSWFLDTRRYGTVPHAGFGLGFERLVLFVTGMTNIRDVIPFPDSPAMRSFKINWSGVKPKLLHYLAELLVVVFGVYLGFMANNYAAELKQKEYVNTTIKEMYQSLEEDAKDAEINKGGHLGGQKAVQYFINLSNNKAVSMDSFELYLFAVLTRSFMSIQNSSPFEAIKAKGFDVITNDSLRKNMIKLYDFQYEGLEKLEEKYQETQFYANEGNRINEILAHSVLYDDDGKFIKVNLPLRIDEKDRNRLILILKRIKFNRGFIVSYYDSIIQDIQKLRKQLEKEYPFVLQK